MALLTAVIPSEIMHVRLFCPHPPSSSSVVLLERGRERGKGFHRGE
jgi:hypothetical protein